MNLNDKLDGLLKNWPAPATRDDDAWEERADLIVEAAVARRSDDKAALAALLEAPPLAAEAGEPAEEKQSSDRRGRGDESTMSQGSDQDAGRKSMSGAPSEKKRQSLKEIAARASQTPPPGKALATPLPAAVATPLPSRPGSLPGVRANEVSQDDSGIIDLAAVNAAATPEQKAQAELAQPGNAPLGFDEAAGGPQSAEARTLRRPTAPARKKVSGGLIGGVAIAVVGLAAAIAIMQTRKGPQQPVATQEAPAAATEQTAPAGAGTASPTAAATTEQPAPSEQTEEDQAAADEEGKLAAGPAAAPAHGGPAGTPPTEGAAAPMAQAKHPASAATGKPDDLSSAMQQAVGDQNSKSEVTEAPEPAAGRPLSQNIPEQPSQGSAQAAIGSAMGAAKACVAGADDVSRAMVTFGSSGAVTSVSVSGWAASNGASGCIKSAFKSANVGPFSKPSFTLPVTIRP